MCDRIDYAAELGTWEREVVYVKRDYRKNKVIKQCDFGWKFKSNLLNWRAAKSASISSR